MHKKAVIKLTLWYVSIITMVCLIFSVSLYSITTYHLERGARRQGQIIQDEILEDFMPTMQRRFEELRKTQLENDRQELLRSLFIINLVIISLGAFLSYLFAKKTLKPIEEAYIAQKRFTTDASHELRTPLATMQAEIEVALRDKQLNIDDAKNILTSNLSDIDKLRSLSEQLLLLARLNHNHIEKSTFDLSNDLKTVASKYPQLSKVIIEENICIYGNQSLVETMIRTIIDNAFKYSKNQPVVSLKLKKDTQHAVITVADRGIGINPSDIPYIFNRFYRSKDTTTNTGHGLGLAIAKDITLMHNGRISITPRKKGGTLVTIKLPIKKTK